MMIYSNGVGEVKNVENKNFVNTKAEGYKVTYPLSQGRTSEVDGQ